MAVSKLTVKCVKALALGSILAVGAGCASTEQMDELKAMVSKAQSDATAAMGAASDAKKGAVDARLLAERAMDAAREAQSCCNANSEKIDRMFKKSMMK